MVNTTYYK